MAAETATSIEAIILLVGGSCCGLVVLSAVIGVVFMLLTGKRT